jgi:exodeoxyribonuclease VII small subunit
VTDQATTGGAAAGPGAPTAPDAAAAERRRVAALPFDRALAEFKAVVEKLETGNLPLEESIGLFEQGVLLQRRCERLLNEAELRFQRLVDGAGGQLRTIDLSLGETEQDSPA